MTVRSTQSCMRVQYRFETLSHCQENDINDTFVTSMKNMSMTKVTSRTPAVTMFQLISMDLKQASANFLMHKIFI